MPTSDMVPGTTIAASLASIKGFGQVSQVAAPSDAVSNKANRELSPAPVDKVILQGRVQNTRTEARRGDSEIPVSRVGSVLFSYNSKGDLRIRFMDSKNAVIYQTPPALIARMIDIMKRADTSVSNSV